MRTLVLAAALSAALSALAAGEVAPVASVPVADGDSGAIAELNALLKQALPGLQQSLAGVLPHSYGACSYSGSRRRRRVRSGPSAPSPCVGGTNTWLFYEHKSWAYKAVARWIGGINSLELTSAVAASATGGLSLAISGLFAELPASIYIGECFTFDQCSILWDNTHACCGSNKHFEVAIDVKCGAGEEPLAGLSVSSVHLDEIKITEKIIGISFDVAHITDKVRDQVTSVLKHYLQDEAFIKYDGKELTLVEYLNTYPMAKGVIANICSQLPSLAV